MISGFVDGSSKYHQHQYNNVVDNSNGNNISLLHRLIAGNFVVIYDAFSCCFRCILRIFVVVLTDVALLQWLML
jgi:hypothetical protein